ncbi:MAG: hypothetical protein Q7R53_00220 [bacterium]|nr:hypothetical protein [bacterium]
MLGLFFLISLLASFIGMSIILSRKIPVLIKLPQTNSTQRTAKDILFNFVKIIKNKTPLEKFSGELFLQKVLSKTRVLVLKLDNKTFHWLVKLREKAQKKKFGENDDYWKGIKTSVINSLPEQPQPQSPDEEKIIKARRPRKKRLPE